MTPALVWFRRDLRLGDNVTLVHALRHVCDCGGVPGKPVRLVKVLAHGVFFRDFGVLPLQDVYAARLRR